MSACEAGQTSFPASSPHSLWAGFAVPPQQAHRDSASLPGLCVSVTAVHTARPSGPLFPLDGPQALISVLSRTDLINLRVRFLIGPPGGAA
ncbi:unnamed protein product [Rangifer tarandus platyrhynchus]|uniref:Uncharacterized protein n=1 Tax=Rangifer tarandus platyrhynchus TaxID=3082113 RepID=A0AC59ZQ50_RANTA